MHTDANTIDKLGGPTAVAELLGIISEPGSVQRVSNWKRRGIPPAVKLEFPHVFLARPELAEKEPDRAEVGHV